MNTAPWVCIVILSMLGCSGAGNGPKAGFSTNNGSTGATSGDGTSASTGSGGATSSGATGGQATSGGAVGSPSSGGVNGSGGGSQATAGSSSDTEGGVAASAVEAGIGALLPDASLPDAGSLGAPITLTMDAFTVPANSEVYMCQQFGNPFGQDVDLVKMVGTMSSGSHHFFLFNMSPGTGRSTTAPIGNCPNAGLEFHPFPFLSQQPEWTVEYPAGFGYPLVSANGLMMNAHFLNATSAPVSPSVTITIYPAKPGTVTTHVGTLFLSNSKITVPAGTPQTQPLAVSASDVPIADQDYTVFTNWSHMHKYSLDFQASANGSVYYDEKQWSEPPLITAGTDVNQSPLLPLRMTAGTKIAWTCSYYNPTSQVMTFGDSAVKNDMCIYLGQYYPAYGASKNPNYPDILYDPSTGNGF